MWWHFGLFLNIGSDKWSYEIKLSLKMQSAEAHYSCVKCWILHRPILVVRIVQLPQMIAKKVSSGLLQSARIVIGPQRGRSASSLVSINNFDRIYTNVIASSPMKTPSKIFKVDRDIRMSWKFMTFEMSRSLFHLLFRFENIIFIDYGFGFSTSSFPSSLRDSNPREALQLHSRLSRPMGEWDLSSLCGCWNKAFISNSLVNWKQ